MRWRIFGRAERLRRQASDWLARLHGPNAQQYRAPFEQWYRAHPDHAAAYDRLAALFETARSLDAAPHTAGIAAYPVSHGGPRLGWPALAAACAAGIVVLAALLFRLSETGSSPKPGVQHETFAAGEGGGRRIALADGSTVVLAPGSALVVEMDSAERRLRLTAGEGRFVVRHDARPFVVDARDARVVARGTEFLVRIADRGTLVSLIEGRIEVSYPDRADRRERQRQSLTAGQQVLIASPRPLAPPSSGSSSQPTMVEFDHTRLAEAIALVNRQRKGRIGLADPRLGELRITGAFHAGDAAEFAAAVAAALELAVEHGADGSLWLRERRRAESPARR